MSLRSLSPPTVVAGWNNHHPRLPRRVAAGVSDEQLRRACLARALALRPGFLVCDEMTTLDASTTATLVGVIREYQRETGAGVLAISHDTLLLDRWATARCAWRT